MGLVKQFRIKSHKKPNSIISFENINLSYGSRLILDNKILPFLKYSE